MNEATKSRRRLVSFNEGLTYIGCGRNLAYKLIGDGQIIAVKMGSRTMIDLDSVDAYHAALPRVTSKGS